MPVILMTTLVKRMRTKKPCQKCRGEEVWILRYQSPGYVRLVTVCSICGTSSVLGGDTHPSYKASVRIAADHPCAGDVPRLAAHS
jgi:hypothetical protein